VFGVKGGLTTIVLNMKGLLTIPYVTSVNSRCEMVLILNNYKKV